MKHHNRHDEELSAWIDGCAENPAAIEAALRDDPALARRLEELRAAGRLLRSLPRPTLRPDFTVATMARIEQDAHPRPARRRLALPLAAAAAITATIGLLLLRDTPTMRPTPPGLAAAPQSQTIDRSLNDDTIVLARLENLLRHEDAASLTDDPWLDFAAAENTYETEATEADAALLIAALYTDDPAADPALDDTLPPMDDSMTDLDSLQPEEIAALSALLANESQ